MINCFLFFVFSLFFLLCSKATALEQICDIFIKASSQINFVNLSLTTHDFEINNNNNLEATTANFWDYSNTESESSQKYKVTGVITSHSSQEAPLGWSLYSALESPNDGAPFGTPLSFGDYIPVPWSDQGSTSYITNLPQAKAGVGIQKLKIIVDSAAHLAQSQNFTLTWTVIAE